MSDLNLVKEINAVFCIKHPVSPQFPRTLMNLYSVELVRSSAGACRMSGMLDVTASGSRGEKRG